MWYIHDMNPVTFTALAEPNRFSIVELLRNGPRPVNEISHMLHLNQPQTSKHLKFLAKTGFVHVVPIAQQRYYELSPQKFEEIDSWINSYRKVWEQRFDRLEKVLIGEKKKLTPRY